MYVVGQCDLCALVEVVNSHADFHDSELGVAAAFLHYCNSVDDVRKGGHWLTSEPMTGAAAAHRSLCGQDSNRGEIATLRF